jgi:hypothetical protein
MALGLAQLVTCVVSEFGTLLGVCVRRNRIGFVALLSFFGAISAMAWTSEPAGELVDPPMCTGSRTAANFSSSCHDRPCISISAKLVLNLGKSLG